MANRADITPELCRQLLRYDPDTGSLYWRKRGDEHFSHCPSGQNKRIANSWNAAWAGKPITSKDGHGYIIARIFALHFKAHRLAWAIHYGFWPEGQIDHIDGVRSNNRISNLRDVPQAENQRNMKRPRHNTSGVSGVYFCKITGQWRAEVRSHGVRHRLGRFLHIEDAKAAVARKRQELNFPKRHGQSR